MYSPILQGSVQHHNSDFRTVLTNANQGYYMVIFPKLSSDTLVPLFQPISRYYMIIFSKLSSDTLGVPSDLKHPTYRYDGSKSLTCQIYHTNQ